MRKDIVYIYHVFGANRLTGVQMDIFIGENDLSSFVLQENAAFMSEKICMKNKNGFSYAVVICTHVQFFFLKIHCQDKIKKKEKRCPRKIWNYSGEITTIYQASHVTM